MSTTVRWVKALVCERRRPGRRRTERTCHCPVLPYPHRSGSVLDCWGELICHHDRPMHGHPNFESRCPECDREEYGHLRFDVWRESH